VANSHLVAGCCTDALGSTDQGGHCLRHAAAVRRCCCSGPVRHASAWSLSSSRGCRVLLAAAAGACCCAVARLQETGWGWAGQRRQLRTMHAASCCAFSVSAAAMGPAWALAEVEGQLGVVACCCCLHGQLAPLRALMLALPQCRALHRAGTRTLGRYPPARPPL
jgi:hypothetical protein